MRWFFFSIEFYLNFPFLYHIYAQYESSTNDSIRYVCHSKLMQYSEVNWFGKKKNRINFLTFQRKSWIKNMFIRFSAKKKRESQLRIESQRCAAQLSIKSFYILLLFIHLSPNWCSLIIILAQINLVDKTCILILSGDCFQFREEIHAMNFSAIFHILKRLCSASIQNVIFIENIIWWMA